MKIEYKFVNTSSEKMNLYKFRKRVFVDEEKRFTSGEDYITDQFDSFDETLNVVAFVDDEIIAAVRVTMEGESGLPVDLQWDFLDFKKKYNDRFASIGWLCSTRKYRNETGLIRGLIKFGVTELKKRSYEHILAVVHPPVYGSLSSCFGIKKIGEPFMDKNLRVEMIPVYGLVDDILSGANREIPQKFDSFSLDCKEQSNGDQPDKNIIKNERENLLKKSMIHGKYHFFERAFSRNIGIFTMAEQEKILNSRVAIAGLGGVGGQHLITLARAGFGNFNIADLDYFEPVNTNRQYGAKLSTFEKSKTETMYKEAMDVNPFLDIRCFENGVSEENIDEFLKDVDLVADGMDFFNFDIRRLIFKKAQEKNIPVITAGPLGFSSALLIFMPDKGMLFDEYFNIRDDLSLEDKLIRFFVGLAPKATQASYIDPLSISMENRKGPSTGAACQLCSSVITTEAIRIILKKRGVKPVPSYFQYDPYAGKFHRGFLFGGNRHPLQKFKYFMVKRALSKNKMITGPKEIPNISVTGKMCDETVKYLISAGMQAPSGDNCQPWKFEYCESYLMVFLEPNADDPFFNLNQIASYIACGAAVENILLAAGRFGISGNVEYLPEKDQPFLIAKIHLSYENKKEDPLQRFIWTRHTNRTKFNRKPLSEPDINTLKGSISDFPDVSLKLITDRENINDLADVIFDVDKIRSERRDLHEHLVKMIRYTDLDALLKMDGFPLKNLEAGRMGNLFLKLSKPWPVMNFLNKKGMGKMVSIAASQGVKQASAIGLLKINGNSTKDFVVGGQSLERLWLECTRQGISFQPMTAVTLFRHRWNLGLKSDFAMAHQQLLGKIWPVYESLFGGNQNESHIMLFRLGYGKPISRRTYRKEIKI